MEPNAFVAEVYRRMSVRHVAERPKPSFAEIQNNSRVLLAMAEYAPLLPADKTVRDLGHRVWRRLVPWSLFNSRLHQPFRRRLRN